jgi:hypothetical protein
MDSFEQDWTPGRREIITHLGTFVVGGLVGFFLEPFKRAIMGILLATPLGREPELVVGYAVLPDFDGRGYQVQISNGGEETAEDIGLNIEFQEKIIDATALNASNMPPTPEVDIEITSGTAEVNIDRLRRQFEGEQIPLFIHFKVDKESQSRANSGFPADDEMSVGYRYSWTFAGVQFYEANTNTITEQEQIVRLEDSSTRSTNE